METQERTSGVGEPPQFSDQTQPGQKKKSKRAARPPSGGEYEEEYSMGDRRGTQYAPDSFDNTQQYGDPEVGGQGGPSRTRGPSGYGQSREFPLQSSTPSMQYEGSRGYWQNYSPPEDTQYNTQFANSGHVQAFPSPASLPSFQSPPQGYQYGLVPISQQGPVYGSSNATGQFPQQSQDMQLTRYNQTQSSNADQGRSLGYQGVWSRERAMQRLSQGTAGEVLSFVDGMFYMQEQQERTARERGERKQQAIEAAAEEEEEEEKEREVEEAPVAVYKPTRRLTGRGHKIYRKEGTNDGVFARKSAPKY